MKKWVDVADEVDKLRMKMFDLRKRMKESEENMGFRRPGYNNSRRNSRRRSLHSSSRSVGRGMDRRGRWEIAHYMFVKMLRGCFSK